MTDPVPSKERDEAIAIANRWLDEPWSDPDDDLRIVARQFMRSLERAAPEPPPKSGRDADEASRDDAAPTPRGSLPNSLGASPEPPAEWQPIESAPKDDEAIFWIRPLTIDDSPWVNTSGEPIIIDSPPQHFVGKYGRWSSLWTATHWQPLPKAPSQPPRDE